MLPAGTSSTNLGQELADRLLGEAGLQREPRLIWPGAGLLGWEEG
jgi:hypothetical protein